MDNMTAGRFAKIQLEAQSGDHESQLIVRAALDDNTTTTAAGLIPTRFLREVIGVIDQSRPFIDSLTREPLPDAGMEFKIPRRTAKPSVAEQSAEGDEVSSDEPTFDFLTVDVKTFAGGQRISRQLIERTDPAFIDRLLIEMASEYAQTIDKFAGDTVAVGSASVPPTAPRSLRPSVRPSPTPGRVMRFAPNNLQVAPTTTGVVRLREPARRPSTPTTVRCSQRPASSSTPEARSRPATHQRLRHGPAARRRRQLRQRPTTRWSTRRLPRRSTSRQALRCRCPSRTSSTLEVEVAVYGYVAMAVKYPTAFRALTVTP